MHDEIAKVRRRPAMYVGSTDSRGLHHMIWELLANAIDEHLAGFCHHVALTLRADGGITVADDGRGLPVAPAPDGQAVMELLLTTPHNGPTADGHKPHIHLVNRGGIGLAPVNALCRALVAESRREGRRFTQRFACGLPTGPMVDEGPASDTGTTISLWPDAAIFGSARPDSTALRERLETLAALLPGLALSFADQRTDRFYAKQRLVSLLEVVRKGRPSQPSPPICATVTAPGISVDLALSWLSGRWDQGAVRSWVNLQETEGGGAHVDGLTDALGALAALRPDANAKVLVQALTSRLLGVVAVWHDAPAYAGPTKARLNNPELRPLVREAVHAALQRFAEERPDEARALLDAMLA